VSAEEALCRDSHYVPQSYMRRFSPCGDKFVYAYRTLVPRAGMREWEYWPTKRIAARKDIYTSVAEGKESDRIERWLNDEVENPAQAVLDRLRRREPLTPRDRKRLARYIASLHGRSPVYYHEHTQMMASHV
jgi:hypothetical protein